MKPAIELPAERTVFRLIKRKPLFLPDGARFPNGEAFSPSSEERSDSESTGLPVRVSVWDRSRTSVAQAAEIRASDVPMLAFGVGVDKVVALRERLEHPRLRVVEDPLEELRNAPGGDGHCGIEGLDHRKGEDRKKYKTLRDELAQQVEPLEDSALLETK